MFLLFVSRVTPYNRHPNQALMRHTDQQQQHDHHLLLHSKSCWDKATAPTAYISTRISVTTALHRVYLRVRVRMYPHAIPACSIVVSTVYLVFARTCDFSYYKVLSGKCLGEWRKDT